MTRLSIVFPVLLSLSFPLSAHADPASEYDISHELQRIVDRGHALLAMQCPAAKPLRRDLARLHAYQALLRGERARFEGVCSESRETARRLIERAHESGLDEAAFSGTPLGDRLVYMRARCRAATESLAQIDVELAATARAQRKPQQTLITWQLTGCRPGDEAPKAFKRPASIVLTDVPAEREPRKPDAALEEAIDWAKGVDTDKAKEPAPEVRPTTADRKVEP